MARDAATDDSKIFVWCRLTPELSRHRFAAAAEPQSYEALPTPRSGVGLNELLGLCREWFCISGNELR